MIFLHEALAVRVAQPCAFAAQGLRHEEPLHAGQAERGGVELVELHVRDGSAGAPGHGNAVAGGHRGIGGVAVDLPCAAAGQQHTARADVAAWCRHD